jgi:hypothetical protein
VVVEDLAQLVEMLLVTTVVLVVPELLLAFLEHLLHMLVEEVAVAILPARSVVAREAVAREEEVGIMVLLDLQIPVEVVVDLDQAPVLEKPAVPVS